MRTLFKYFSFFVAIFTLVLFACGIVQGSDFMLMFGGSGLSHASAIAGGLTTDEMNILNADVLKKDYEKTMTILRANEFPMDQFMRTTKKSITWKNWTVKYPEVETRPVEDTVASTSVAVTTDLVTSYALITVTNPDQWMVDDVIRFEGYVDTVGKNPLTGVITAINGSVCTVFALNGQGTGQGTVGYNIPSIASATVITRIGNSKYEKDAQTSVWNAVPETDENHMQIHMGQVEESVIYALHNKDIAYDKDMQELLAMYNFRNESESTALFGMRCKRIINGKQRYFSGGAEYFIDNVLNYGTAANTTLFTDEMWVDLTKEIFTDNAGSTQRVMFAGKDLIAAISKIDTVQKQINATGSQEVQWGVKYSKVQTNFGELLIKYHKMLDMHAWEANAFVLDFAHIDKYVMEPFEKRTMDYDVTGTARVKSERFLETSCFGFKYPGTHFKIKPYGLT